LREHDLHLKQRPPLRRRQVDVVRQAAARVGDLLQRRERVKQRAGEAVDLGSWIVRA
jgi:hypothetical protein